MLLKTEIHLELSFRDFNSTFQVSHGSEGGGRRNANNQKRISLLYPSQEIKKALAPAAPSRLLLIKQDIPFTPNSDEL